MKVNASATRTTAAPAVTTVSSALLQRQCDCGQHTTAGGECEECKKKKGMLQRQATNGAEPRSVPPIVHEVLRSPGQALDRSTRGFLEPRFGRDFSQVRVHTDARASESARAVAAAAYTVGNNIVFGAGRYAPHSNTGMRLMAHELTHVLQQSGSNGTFQGKLLMNTPGDGFEQEADASASAVMESRAPALRLSNPQSMLSRQGCEPPTRPRTEDGREILPCDTQPRTGTGEHGRDTPSCETQTRSRPGENGHEIQIQRIVTAGECRRRAVTRTDVTSGGGTRPHFSATLCRGDVEAGASGELDFSQIINQFGNFLNGLPGAAGSGGINNLAQRTLGSATTRGNIQFVLRINTFRVEAGGRTNVSGSGVDVHANGLLRYTNGQFRIEGTAAYDFARNLQTGGNQDAVTVTLGTDLGPIELRLRGRAASSPASATRDDLTFDGTIRYRTGSGAVGVGVNVGSAPLPGGERNTQVIFSLRFEEGGRIPQERSPDCYECCCNLPEVHCNCTDHAPAGPRPPGPPPAQPEYVPLFFNYAVATPREPEYAHMLREIVNRVEQGYTIASIEGQTSPEGPRGEGNRPRRGAGQETRFVDNEKLAQDRATAAETSLRAALQTALDRPGDRDLIMREETRQQHRNRLQAALAAIPAPVGHVPAEMFGDFPSGREIPREQLFTQLQSQIGTPAAGQPDPLEQQHVTGAGVPQEAREEAERDAAEFRTGQRTDTATHRVRRLTPEQRLQAIYPVFRRALVTLNPPPPPPVALPSLSEVLRAARRVVGDPVPCTQADHDLFRNVPIPTGCLVDHCSQGPTAKR